MIEIDNVHKSFGNLEVVKGVNLTVNKGEVVSISPHYCRLGTGLTMFGDVVEGRGGTAAIG